MNHQKQRTLKRIIMVVVLAVLIGVGINKRATLIAGLEAARSAHFPGLVAGMVLSIAAMVAMGIVMNMLLRAGGTKVHQISTFNLVTAANAWSATFPGGQAFSTVLTFQILRKWGVSALVSSWMMVLSASLSSLWLAGLGITAIFLLGARLSVTSLVVTGVFLVLLSWLVYWLSKHPEILIKRAPAVMRQVNRLRRKPATQDLDKVVQSLAQLDDVTLTPGQFIIAAVASLLNWLCELLVLWCCVWAVTGIPPLQVLEEPQTNSISFAGITLAFVTAKIAGTLQTTPAGLGPVEAALNVALVAMSLTAEAAMGAVFLYRLLTLFFIAGLGWILYFAVFYRQGLTRKALTQSEKQSSQEH